MLKGHLCPRGRRTALVALAAIVIVVTLINTGISRWRRSRDVRWWRGLADWAPWPDPEKASANVREVAARRLMQVVTMALKDSHIAYSVGGPTLFNCHVFRNLTSPLIRGDPRLQLDGLSSRSDVGRIHWAPNDAVNANLRAEGVGWAWVPVHGWDHCKRGPNTTKAEQRRWMTVWRNGTEVIGILGDGSDVSDPRVINRTDALALCTSLPKCAGITFAAVPGRQSSVSLCKPTLCLAQASQSPSHLQGMYTAYRSIIEFMCRRSILIVIEQSSLMIFLNAQLVYLDESRTHSLTHTRRAWLTRW